MTRWWSLSTNVNLKTRRQEFQQCMIHIETLKERHRPWSVVRREHCEVTTSRLTAWHEFGKVQQTHEGHCERLHMLTSIPHECTGAKICLHCWFFSNPFRWIMRWYCRKLDRKSQSKRLAMRLQDARYNFHHSRAFIRSMNTSVITKLNSPRVRLRKENSKSYAKGSVWRTRKACCVIAVLIF